MAAQDDIPLQIGWCCDPGRDPFNPADLYGHGSNPLIFCNFHRSVVCQECGVDFTDYNEAASQDPELPEDMRREMVGFTPPPYGPADATVPFRITLDLRVPSFHTTFLPDGQPSMIFVVLLTWKEGGMVFRTARIDKKPDSFRTLFAAVADSSPELRRFKLPTFNHDEADAGSLCTAACHDLLQLVAQIVPMPRAVREFLQLDDRGDASGAGGGGSNGDSGLDVKDDTLPLPPPTSNLPVSTADRNRLESLREMMVQPPPRDSAPLPPAAAAADAAAQEDNEHQRPRRVTVTVGKFVRKAGENARRGSSLAPKLGHVTYNVMFEFTAGEPRGVVKRYSEFEDLYQRLAEHHAVVQTIDFPRKLVSSNLYGGSSKELRREKFEQILQLVIQLRPLPPEICDWIEESSVQPLDDGAADNSDTGAGSEACTPPARDSGRAWGASSSWRGSKSSRDTTPPPSTARTSSASMRDEAAPDADDTRSLNGDRHGPDMAAGSHAYDAHSVASYDSIDDPITRGRVMDTLERAFHEKHAMENELLRKKVELSSASQTIQEDNEIISAYESRLSYLEALSNLEVRICDWERDGRDRHIKFLIEVRGVPTSAPGSPTIDKLVRRRYQEFLVLDRRLHSQIPLPGKLYFFRNNTAALETRRRSLEAYLQRAVQLYAVDRVTVLRDFLGIGEKPQLSARVTAIAKTRSMRGSFSAGSVTSAASRPSMLMAAAMRASSSSSSSRMRPSLSPQKTPSAAVTRASFAGSEHSQYLGVGTSLTSTSNLASLAVPHVARTLSSASNGHHAPVQYNSASAADSALSPPPRYNVSPMRKTNPRASHQADSFRSMPASADDPGPWRQSAFI